MTLKQIMIKLGLEKDSVFGFLNIGINSGKEAFSNLIIMHSDFVKESIEFEKALLKQTLIISDGIEPVTLKEAFMQKQFYEAILESSLQYEMPELYELAMQDYLNMNQAIELHLSTHTLEGKVTKNAKNKKRKKEATLSVTHSDTTN